MAPLAKKMNEKYTYADYLTWDDDTRWELIEGVPYNMTPAPDSDHQTVSGELFGIIWLFLKKRQCRVFAAPFDVRLIEKSGVDDPEVKTVVQPDIVVICDEKKIDKGGCLGTPDIVVEILSPSTAYKDEGEKLKLYEKHGVKEYWIVNPEARYIMIYRLENSKYGKPEYLTENETLESRVLEGLRIELSEVWSKV
jgi:Uma2 family endonuclease